MWHIDRHDSRECTHSIVVSPRMSSKCEQGKHEVANFHIQLDHPHAHSSSNSSLHVQSVSTRGGDM